ncbi:hypothetical protein F4777DRAFT_535212 [Nemania sp. FL0916]|nr:hypothetical protein F4777DRAFT_535212 [Nemania sp. FL0916]
MHIAPMISGSAKQNRLAQRDTDPGIVLSALLVPIFVFVFGPLFFFMYRSWRWEKQKQLGLIQGAIAVEQGRRTIFEKAELPNGPSHMIHEIEHSQETHEVPAREGGLPHELFVHNMEIHELPAAIHEMPTEPNIIRAKGGKCDKKPLSILPYERDWRTTVRAW